MVTVLPDQHKVRFFASPDLKAWTPLSDFGPAGATGGVWECPDLFELPVEGEPGETRWVLDVDINPGGVAGGSGGQYFVGTFDGTPVRQRQSAPIRRSGPTTARTSTRRSRSRTCRPADGRRIWMAWISNWQYANDEPTVIVARRAVGAARRWRFAAVPDGLRLVQAPVAELERCARRRQPSAVAGSDAAPAVGRDRTRGAGRATGAKPAFACRIAPARK